MRSIIDSYIQQTLEKPWKESGKNLSLEGIPGGSCGFFIAALSKMESQTSMVVVTSSNLEAETLSAELQSFIDAGSILYLPGYEAIPYDFSGWSSDITAERIPALYRIISGEKVVAVTSIDALIRKMPPIATFAGNSLELFVNQEIPPRTVEERLVAMGYTRVDRVEVPGDFTRKGELLDLFPANLSDPLRLDYFDDQIESIRTFHPDSQLAMGSVDRAMVLPACEVILDPGNSRDLINQLIALRDQNENRSIELPVWVDASLTSGEDYGEDDAESTTPPEAKITEFQLNQLLHPGVEELFPLVMEGVGLASFFQHDTILVQINPDRIETRVERIWREFNELHAEESSVKYALPPQALLMETPLVFNGISGRLNLSSTGFASGNREVPDSTDAAAGAPPARRWNLESPPRFRGRIRDIRQSILDIFQKGNRVLITSPYPAQVRRIAGIFRSEEGIPVTVDDSEKTSLLPDLNQKSGLWIVKGSLQEGFALPDAQLYIWSDTDLFGRSYRSNRRFKGSASSPIESFLDLKEGDYVVHVNYGVGQFHSLERVKAAGRERDFLVLEYADDDRLYVPLDQISLVQKYASPMESPKLDSLGKASFKKVKERVEKRVEEFAQELIKIYAIRMSQQGLAFPEDTAWQDEFESEFPYSETPDQLAAIESVKRDMESVRPMDRLICGDVGYGKTEVAIRAAFKAVMSGRQVIFIAPTTILAMQHHRNFSQRFTDYPIKVDWISRFRTRGEINGVKRSLREGEVDIVIGTHALLARDMHVKNLGLLIVDEEQRFGVAQKEAIKNMKKLVDVLTLTATPIPRTLHMSLVGIRDVSIIQTPPQDRLPVRTYVMEDSEPILTEAIRREVERGGQVFYLHNRVETIHIVAERLRSLMPDLSFAVLHGQMEDDQIEDVLLDFLERRYEVLVTTTIIESGIDMPNVNTLIIDRADTFGLAQLYQIRGRVGRSNRQAYAYLFFPEKRALTETAQKRLNTILEYQELGSGFKVAMRDLEIRGAGNVLGREQSGDIVEVGYELYVKLLDEAVRRYKGEKVEADVRTAINLKSDFFIPEDYIVDVRQRIEFYKRYEAASGIHQVVHIASEMENRFGTAPPAARVFILLEKIRTIASRGGFESVYEEDKPRICFKAGEHFRIPPPHLILIMQRYPALTVQPGQTDTLFFLPEGEGEEMMSEVLSILLKLTDPLLDEEDREEAQFWDGWYKAYQVQSGERRASRTEPIKKLDKNVTATRAGRAKKGASASFPAKPTGKKRGKR